MDTNISADDLQDVQELTENLYKYMNDLLKDHERRIVINVFMGAFASIFYQMSNDEEELMVFCAAFLAIIKKIIDEDHEGIKKNG